MTFYTLFAIRLRTRQVHIIGSTARPHRHFVKQAALDLTAYEDSFLRDCTHLILDRDSKYTHEFHDILDENGICCVPIPPRSPNCSPHAERFVRSIKEECLDRFILLGRSNLERAIREYVEHYHRERNHQGLQNQLIEPAERSPSSANAIVSSPRLGGLLNYYSRAS